MPKIAVVTDSTADLPLETYMEHGITIVPLLVHFGNEAYKDCVELSGDQFYHKLASSKVLPKTSQPSPHDFQVVYEELLSQSDGIASIHLSSKLSGTYQSAKMAASVLGDDRIQVIDGRTASGGTGLLALEAARLARLGADMRKILEQVEELKKKIRVCFTVDTLEYLRRNGRIGKAAAFLGTILSIRPLLAIDDGEVMPVEKVRGSRERVLKRLVEVIAERMPGGKVARGIVMHAAEPARGAALKESLERQASCKDLLIGSIGPVIGSHGGPGTIGAALYPVD